MPSHNATTCISVINMKGGVGKTTVAALLSRYAAEHRRCEVLAVDLDPQANLSQALMGERRYQRFLNARSPSIVEVFNGYQPPGPNTASASPLNISEAVQNAQHPWSLGYGDNLQIIPSRFDFSDNLIAAARPDPHCLARLIAEHFQHKDLIIIDCAPTESIFTQVAYHASRYILVPVRPEFFATIGFPLLNESLDGFRNSNRGHSIDVIGVVINNATYDGGNDGGPEKVRAMEEIKSEAAKNEWRVFRNELGYSRGFPKMMRGDFNYPGNADVDFRAFARELFSTPEMDSIPL